MNIPLAIVLGISGFVPRLLPARGEYEKKCPAAGVFEPVFVHLELRSLCRSFLRYALTFLFILIICLETHSQRLGNDFNFRFDHLTVNDGLPTPAVIDIFRDKRGFIWFYSTRDIVRYDGFEYRRYPFAGQPHDLNRFGADPTSAVYTTDGTDLFRYDPVSDRFVHIPLPEPLGRKEALSFLLSTNREAQNWFRHGNRLYRLDGTGSAPALVSDRLFSSDRFVGLVDRKGHVWLSNVNNGTPTSRLQRISPTLASSLEPGVPSIVHHIQEDPGCKLWLGTWTKGLWQYDPGSKKMRSFTNISAEDVIFEIGLFPEWTGTDLLWCNSGTAGIYLFDRKKERLVQVLRSSESRQQALIANNIYIFHYDREHIL